MSKPRRTVRQTPRKATARSGPVLPRLDFLAKAGFWRNAAWLAVIVAAVIGLQRVDAFARAELQPDVRLEWVDLPDWLRDPHWATIIEDLSQVDDQPLVYPDTRVLPDPNHPDATPVTHWVYDNLARSAWIEKLERVTLVSDGRVRVHARFRRPFASIEKDGVCCLVDQQGVRLPVDWDPSRYYTQHWFRITGVRQPIPRIGHRWQGADVEAGLALARYLEECSASDKLPFREELRSIDVGEYDEIIGGLRIITRNPGSYIVWGHVPGKGYGVDATAQEKVATLITLYSQQGGMPDRGPFTIRNAPEVRFYYDEHPALTGGRP